jgi:hypothetical protein
MPGAPLRNTRASKAVALLCAFLLVFAPRLAWAPYGTGGTLTSATTNSLILDIANRDTILVRDAANTLAQRNGTNAQTFRLYNTFTDAANYERARVQWTGNQLRIGTEFAGTGAARTMVLQATNLASLGFGLGTETWNFNAAAGHFIAGVDNTQDIGTTGANRPRDIYSARHFRSEAATVPTMGACGTTPSVTGSDHGATITVGAGGVATTCAMNFGVAFTAIPACVVNSNTDSTAFTVTTATGSVTITKATAFTAGSKLFVICMGS